MSLLDNYKEQVKNAPKSGTIASTSPFTAFTAQSAVSGGTLVDSKGVAVAPNGLIAGVVLSVFNEPAVAVLRNVSILDSGDVWLSAVAGIAVGDSVEAKDSANVRKQGTGAKVGVCIKIIGDNVCVRLSPLAVVTP